MARFSKYDFKIHHIKEKENKVVDALRRNENLNFTAVITTYTTDLEEQLKAGIDQDEIYQNLQAKTKENST